MRCLGINVYWLFYKTGYGVYRYDNKFFRYEGQWEGGLKHGETSPKSWFHWVILMIVFFLQKLFQHILYTWLYMYMHFQTL